MVYFSIMYLHPAKIKKKKNTPEYLQILYIYIDLYAIGMNHHSKFNIG